MPPLKMGVGGGGGGGDKNKRMILFSWTYKIDWTVCRDIGME